MQEKKRWLCFRFTAWFFLFNSLLCLIFGFGYLQAIIQSATLFKNLIFEYSNWYGKALVIAFVATTYFSYMCLLAFLPSILPFLLSLIVPNKKIVTIFTVCIAFVFLIIIAVDSKLFYLYKYHLNIPILQMLFSFNVRDFLDLSEKEILSVVLALILVLMFLIIIAYIVWKYIIPKKLYFGKNIMIIWVGAALFSYFTLMLSLTIQHNNLLIQQVANLPYYNNLLALITPKKNAKDWLNRYSEGSYMQSQFSHDNLHYPKNIMQCSQENTATYNIIFIIIDSLRQDSLQYMSMTEKFSKQNLLFLNHYSGGNATQSGLFTLFYSIPSNYWTAALEQNISPVFINLLLKNNYNMRVIWSSDMHNPPVYKTIYNKISNLNLDKFDSKNASDWDRETTREAIKYLKETREGKKPFFLNIFYNAPHAFCRAEDFPIKYKPIAKECSRISMTNDSDPRPFFNSYLNTLSFIDLEIQKVLDAISENSLLDNSIVIITSDHGQEFNENNLNYWGHASNYSTYQVQVPLIIHWPGKGSRKFKHLTTHYDLMPTLLSRVFNCKNSFADYSIGNDLFNMNRNIQFILLGSYANMGIIEQDRLTTLHVSGDMTITDLHMQPLEDAHPRMDVLQATLKIMREFFH